MANGNNPNNEIEAQRRINQQQNYLTACVIAIVILSLAVLILAIGEFK